MELRVLEDSVIDNLQDKKIIFCVNVPSYFKEIEDKYHILNKPHIKDYQIHQGNALGKWCLTDFSEEYLTKFDPQYIDDENYINNKQKQVSLF